MLMIRRREKKKTFKVKRVEYYLVYMENIYEEYI